MGDKIKHKRLLFAFHEDFTIKYANGLLQKLVPRPCYSIDKTCLKSKKIK